VRDGNGCTLDLSATVTQPGGLQVSDSLVDPTCFGSTDGAAYLTPTAGTAPFLYSLNGGAAQSSGTFTGLGAGLLNFTITDSNNCVFTIVDSLVQPALLTGIDSVVHVLCPGQGGGEFWVTQVAGGTQPYSYSLNGGPAQSSPSFTGLFPSSFTATVTDANGCVLTLGPVNLTEPQPFNGVLVAQDVLCNGGNDGSIEVTLASGGTPPYRFSIDGINYQSSTIFAGLSAGSVTITLQDSVGCLQTLLGIVSEPAALAGIMSAVPATCNTPNGSASIQLSGGVGGYTYLWNNGGTVAQPSNLAPGMYWVTATDTNSCAYVDSILVPALNVPSLVITNSANPLCIGDANGFAVASANGGTGPLTYQWTPGGSTSDSLAGLAAGTYTVSVIDSIGCIVTNSVTLTDPASLVLAADSLDPSCFGFADGSASVLASGGTPGYTYLWSDGQADSLALALTSGAYSVTVADANGCVDSVRVSLQDPPPVVAAFASNPGMPIQLLLEAASVSLINQSTNASSYFWEFGDGDTSSLSNPTHTYSQIGTFCVTLTAYDSVGCQDTAQACAYTIYVEELRIPNTFTPNGDAVNDIFEIIGVTQFPNNKLSIFNRWGNLVYEKSQYLNEWDGRNFNDGKPLPDGGYFYIFETGEPDVAPLQGNVVIFR
jgi:gliding motility-associated-like protein